MDWVKRMNEAIGYIEDHITEEIAYSDLAKIAFCSSYHFQRMFSYITGVPISEYIRRRRLTLAAFELQNSSIKVIDLALKYNYDSPEAFTFQISIKGVEFRRSGSVFIRNGCLRPPMSLLACRRLNVIFP